MLIAVLGFVAAALVILVVGPRMARTADTLGEATGMGGALFGVVFLALATDLPEVTLTPTAVLTGTPGIAIGNLLGSAVAQLAVLSVVDILYREGRVHHHAPLAPTVGQCGLMVGVLALPLLFSRGGPVVLGVDVGAILLAFTYVAGLAALRGLERDELPPPVDLPEPEEEEREWEREEPGERPDVGSLWLRFGGFAVFLAGAGVALELTSERIGSAIGVTETAAGALLAGVATSLPELVTASSAARSGALGLAVGNLVGSSALDVGLLSLAGVFYREGSVFELLGRAEFALIGAGLALTALIVIGLVRQAHRPSARVALESYLSLGVYAVAVLVLLLPDGG